MNELVSDWIQLEMKCNTVIATSTKSNFIMVFIRHCAMKSVWYGIRFYNRRCAFLLKLFFFLLVVWIVCVSLAHFSLLRSFDGSILHWKFTKTNFKIEEWKNDTQKIIWFRHLMKLNNCVELLFRSKQSRCINKFAYLMLTPLCLKFEKFDLVLFVPKMVQIKSISVGFFMHLYFMWNCNEKIAILYLIIGNWLPVTSEAIYFFGLCAYCERLWKLSQNFIAFRYDRNYLPKSEIKRLFLSILQSKIKLKRKFIVELQ